MKSRILVLVLLTAAGVMMLQAQERTSSSEKKEPEARRVELPTMMSSQLNAQQNPLLPKIELPEFVITGIASFSVPDVQKEAVEESARMVDLSAWLSNVGKRERETVELETPQKEFLVANKSPVLNGQVVASLGSYFTPRVNLWLGQMNREYDYRVVAGYHRTKGYAANTDRSGGNLGVNGGVMFTSGALQGGRLGGDASWGAETYRFFGSLTPSARRTRSNSLFGVSIASSSNSNIIWKAGLGYRYDTIEDNTVETKQDRVNLGAEAEYPMEGVTLKGSVKYNNATLSGASSGGVSLFNIGLGTSRYWWNRFFVQGAAHVYVAKGMANQSLTRIYPEVTFGSYLYGKHFTTVSYAGSIGFVDFASALDAHSYLSSSSVLRHADRSRQITFAVESDWTDALRTKLNVSYEWVNDYGLYADPLGTGIWQLTYGGKTRLWNIRADGFAKLTPNDYVAAKVSMNSTKNSVTQLAVPYVPDFEIVGSYKHQFPFGINVSSNINYQHHRETDLITSQELPGFFLLGIQADYELLSLLRVFIDLQNITNAKYELWKGYQAPPLMVTGGVSFRW